MDVAQKLRPSKGNKIGMVFYPVKINTDCGVEFFSEIEKVNFFCFCFSLLAN